MALKIYKPSELKDSPNEHISTILDDDVIFVENVSFLIDNYNPASHLIDDLYDKTKQYKCIVIYHYEHIYINGFLEILNRYYKDDKIVIFNTFTSGIKHYFDKKFPNNKFYVKSILDNIKAHIPPIVEMQRNLGGNMFDINTKDKRKYLLKAFSFNRSPHRDYIMDTLLKRNLVEGNNISFHNHPFNVGKEEITYDKLIDCNNAYNTQEARDLYNTLDYNTLNSISIIPELQNFDIHNQPEHTKQNSLASTDSYFEILSEPQMPLSDDIENSSYYTYCVTKRTLTTMFFGTVFHTMPFSKLMIDDFNKNGFCTFFNSNEEFFENLNEDYFFKNETIEKLNHNHRIIKEYITKHIEMGKHNKNFVFSKLEEIFSVEMVKYN